MMEEYTQYTTEWQLEQVVPYLLKYYFGNHPTTNTTLSRAFCKLMGENLTIGNQTFWKTVPYNISLLVRRHILEEVQVNKDGLVSISAYELGAEGERQIKAFVSKYSRAVIESEIEKYLGIPTTETVNDAPNGYTGSNKKPIVTIASEVNSPSHRLWWEQLDDCWQKIFKNALGITHEPNEKDLVKILNLQEINCNRAKIQQLTSLRKLENLRSLNCIGTSITSLEPIRHLTRLLKLRCSRTLINDLEPIQNLTSLQELLCRSTRISDITPLKNLSDLRILNISSTQVTNLDPLHQLTKLKLLYVRYIPAKSLTSLQELPRLRKLYCKGIQVSPDEIEQLQKKLPHCEIFWKRQSFGKENFEGDVDVEEDVEDIEEQLDQKQSPSLLLSSELIRIQKSEGNIEQPAIQIPLKQHEISSSSLEKQELFQSQAGYVLDAIQNILLRDEKNAENVRKLLAFLSYFDVETETGLPPRLDDPDPVVAALHNILIRGLPTKPSIYLEELFAEVFQYAQKTIDAIGGIHYACVNQSPDDSLFFRALHVIDPRLDAQYLSAMSIQRAQLESQAEIDFLYKETRREPGEFLIQLVEPQRLLSTIVGKIAQFPRQRVDFAVEFPYPISGKQGLVIEIDGPQHASSANQTQYRLDQERDQAIGNAGWARPLRLRMDGFDQQRLQVIETKRLLQEEYFRILANNYMHPLYANAAGLNALQLALSPFAIARLQRILLELMLRGVLDVTAKTWKIAVVERDVPCAFWAIEDLKHWFTHLFALENRGRTLPTIQLQVFVSDEFQSAQLNQHLPLQTVRFSPLATIPTISDDTQDVLIDVAMLQRSRLTKRISGISHRYEVRLRSAYTLSAPRTFVTTDLIAYRPVARKLPDETYEILPEPEKALTYCLQSIFRKDRFRPGQLEILNRALQLQSVIGLLPTGGGKSLTYQLAALLQPGLALVIDPLKSLMKDQYENLRKNAIDACVYINSSLTTKERVDALGRVTRAEVLFVFVSPERLQITEFRDTLTAMAQQRIFFSYGVIDEVHCVSEWGHDFRTSYLKLGENMMNFCKTKNTPTIPLLGLTATASFDVLSDVQRELSSKHGLERLGEDAIIRFETANRSELQFAVIKVDVPDIPPDAGLFDIKAAIGQAKQFKVKELLQQLPQSFAGYHADPRYSELALEYFEAERFFADNCIHAGIVFCPHRSWYFGVTDQYKADAAAGKGVYDYLFLQPDDENSASGSKLPALRAGIFMGSSEEDTANRKIEQDSIQAQENFINNKIHLLVATKAFGMGIDKPNIRFTIHVNYPSSLEGFVQEAGRAGRDRKLSLSIVRTKIMRQCSQSSQDHDRRKRHDLMSDQALAG